MGYAASEDRRYCFWDQIDYCCTIRRFAGVRWVSLAFVLPSQVSTRDQPTRCASQPLRPPHPAVTPTGRPPRSPRLPRQARHLGRVHSAAAGARGAHFQGLVDQSPPPPRPARAIAPRHQDGNMNTNSSRTQLSLRMPLKLPPDFLASTKRPVEVSRLTQVREETRSCERFFTDPTREPRPVFFAMVTLP